MPYRRVNRRAPKRLFKRKAAYRKKRIVRRRQNNPSKMVFRPHKALGAVLPERYITKMNWSKSFSQVAASGYVDYKWYGNSVYDAGASTDTANAIGYSTLIALYRRFVVYGSRATIRYTNSSTTPKSLLLTMGETIPGTTPSMLAAPYRKYKLVGTNTGTPAQVMSQYMSSKRLLAVKDLKDNEDCIGSLSAVPARPWYWNFRIDNQTGSGTDADFLNISCTYFVEFYDRYPIDT